MILTRTSYPLAYDHVLPDVTGIDGDSPCVVFCPGFNSTKQGAKALAIETLCRQNNIEFIRFDYGGHGESGGDFAQGSISAWLNDTLDVIERLPKSRQVMLVGSSMGGWIALLAAIAKPNIVGGLLLIACAADMTRYYPSRLKGLPTLSDERGRNYFSVPNEYGDQLPYRVYQHLIDDGGAHYLLDQPIDLTIPVRLIHGVDDDVVEWQRSERVLAQLTSKDATLQLIKNGDHRLSNPRHIAHIQTALSDLINLGE